ncbi:MAG: DUF6503 family protein [Cyclobacteriaceae bacterium]
MKYSIFFLLTIIFISSCKSDLTDPQIIVDKSIEAHGGKNYENVLIEFDFRDRHYSLERKGGRFVYTRETQDTLGVLRDVLINASNFKRYLNETQVVISEERKTAFTSSVNSVLYFVQLPYPLNDGAVNKEFLGQTELEGNEYYKIKVTFDQTGGGEDYEDIFCYWINKNGFTVDYIAYSYAESEGIGSRLRKAYNRQEIGGIIFQDYINYKPKKELGIQPVEIHDQLLSEGKLEELSRIENENIEVRQLN